MKFNWPMMIKNHLNPCVELNYLCQKKTLAREKAFHLTQFLNHHRTIDWIH